MSYTKRQFVEGALEEIGMASYVFDLSPENLQAGLRRLDAMMSDWNGRGLRLGYPIPASPDDSSLDKVTGVPDWANDAIITNLAIRIAPSYGKTISGDTRISAKNSLNMLYNRCSDIPEMSLGPLPAGAGNKPVFGGDNFLPGPSPTLDAGSDSVLEFM